MGGGLIKGVFWGVIVALGVAAAVSLMAPPPVREQDVPVVESEAAEEPAPAPEEAQPPAEPEAAEVPPALEEAPVQDLTPEAEAEAEAPAAPSPLVAPLEGVGETPALRRYAAPFENPQDRPVISVVLLGAETGDSGAWADAGVPLSFALDPTRVDAASVAGYRAAGHELVILATGLPTQATAADISVALQSHMRNLPEAVAVMDVPAGGFETDERKAAQVVAVLAGKGLGLVAQPRNRNFAAEGAARQGVAAEGVFLSLDTEGASAEAISRQLDRARLKAAQDGPVIVLGRMSPETLAGLRGWLQEGLGRDVALAPVSAVLLGE